MPDDKAAKRRNEAEYVRTHLKTVVFRLHKVYDADVIAYLDSLENRQGTLKRLLREEMERRGLG